MTEEIECPVPKKQRPQEEFKEFNLYIEELINHFLCIRTPQCGLQGHESRHRHGPPQGLRQASHAGACALY